MDIATKEHKDTAAIKKIIETTGVLKFHEAYSIQETQGFIRKINILFETEAQSNTLFENIVVQDIYLHQRLIGGPVGFYDKKNKDKLRPILELPSVKALLDSELKNSAFQWGMKEEFEKYPLYIVNKETNLTGSSIKKVNEKISKKERSLILLDFDEQGAEAFKKITQQSIKKGGYIAFSLDGEVFFYPRSLYGKAIEDGSVQISGYFTKKEVRFIVSIIRSGPIPKIKVASIKKKKE